MSNESIIKHIYDRLAVGDFQPVFDSLAPHFEWTEAENIPYSPGYSIKDPAEIQSVVFNELAKDFADFHINVISISSGGATVLVEGRYVGKTNSGKDLDAIYAHVWDLKDDKVVRFQQYSDTYQWRRVLGVTE